MILCVHTLGPGYLTELRVASQVYGTVMKDVGSNLIVIRENPDEHGYVNQHGLSRKACLQK